MAMFTNIIFFVIYCRSVPSCLGQYPPQEIPLERYPWTQRLMIYRLINMTAEILHDTTQKMKHGMKIRDMHKSSITFELGTISAGIQERFQKMVKIYRKFANNKDFQANLYTIPQYLHAFHVIQGDYNEIRLEKSLFHEIKKKYESTTTVTYSFKDTASTEPQQPEKPQKPQQTQQPQKPQQSQQPKQPEQPQKNPKNPDDNNNGRRRRKWSPPKAEHFYNFPGLDKIET